MIRVLVVDITGHCLSHLPHLLKGTTAYSNEDEICVYGSFSILIFSVSSSSRRSTVASCSDCTGMHNFERIHRLYRTAFWETALGWC
jgi:hypothetical protein